MKRLSRLVTRQIFKKAVGRSRIHLVLCAAGEMHGNVRVINTPQFMISGQGLRRGHIKKGPADGFGFQRCNQRVLINH